MINNLRKKIVLVNVLLASIIFLSALVAIFAVSYTRISKTVDDKMNMAIECASRESPAEFTRREEFNDVIVLKVNLSARYIVVYCTNLDPDEIAFLESQVDDIINNVKDSGMITAQFGRYKRVYDQDDSNTMYIAIINNLSAYNGLSSLIGYSALTTLIGLACFITISFMLADLALKPVEKSWTQQKQFVADASHELKTPLSIIMANTEIIASNPDKTVESQMQWIDNTRAESKRMSQLIANLLFLAKNDDGLKVQLDNVNLSECTGNMCLAHESLFYENDKTFNSIIDPNIEIFGNQQQLMQLVTILLDNANKYSVGKGNIQLQLIDNNKSATLIVSNDCVELSQNQLAHLFDRFYTVDVSRNNNSSGNGLGLSIAKLIVETHKGKISAVCENGKITFTATLPLNKKQRNTSGNTAR